MANKQKEEEIKKDGQTEEVKEYDVAASDQNIDDLDKDLEQEKKRARKYRMKEIAKMMAIICIPVISCVAITITSFSNSYKSNYASQVITAKLKDSKMMMELVNDLQRERALAVFYLLYNNDTFLEMLKEVQQRVDNHLRGMVSESDYLGQVVGSEFNLVNELQEKGRTGMEPNKVLKFYMEINAKFIHKMVTRVEVPLGNPIWKTYSFVTMMLQGVETAAEKMLIGANYFLNCKISQEDLTAFVSSSDQSKSYQEVAFFFDKKLFEKYDSEASDLLSKIKKMSKSILVNSENCPKSKKEKMTNSFVWSNLCFRYNEVQRNLITTELARIFENDLSVEQETNREFIFNCILLTVISIGASVTLFYYASGIFKMTRNVIIYSLKMSKEKKKAETLLYQLLPQTVAGG